MPYNKYNKVVNVTNNYIVYNIQYSMQYTL